MLGQLSERQILDAAFTEYLVTCPCCHAVIKISLGEFYERAQLNHVVQNVNGV